MALSIQWVDSQTAKATFVGNVPSADMLADAWRFSIVAASGDSVTVYDSVPADVVGVTVIRVGPSVEPGETYTITFGNEESVQRVPNHIVAPDSPEWAHGLFDTITQAFGQAVQKLSGKPQTLVVTDFEPGQSTLFVESTLGFPTSGSLFVGGEKYTYTGKGAMAFHTVESVEFSLSGQRKKALVTLDVRSILPA